MITVLFGTNPYPFKRLSSIVELLSRTVDDEIVVQTGYSKAPESVTCYDFLPHDEIIGYIKRSRVVICHGGFGSITDALALKVPVVVVARKLEFNEAKDGGKGQSELVDALVKQDIVVECLKPEDITQCIEVATSKSSETLPTSKIPTMLLHTVSEWLS